MHHSRLRSVLSTALAVLAAVTAFPAALSAAYVKPEKRAPFTFSEEIKTRQLLLQVALAREQADLIIRGPDVLDVRTLTWMRNQDIVIR